MNPRYILLILLFPLSLAAQGTYPYEWEKNRQRYTLTPQEDQAPEIILKDHIEYAYAFENDQFIMYCVIHRIVRVNNSEAIQRHNRITISMERAIELVEVKARSINSQNKIASFDKNNLKEVKEEGTEGRDRIFAMEGVELGSEIEYFFIRKMTPALFSNAYLQMDVPIRHVSFVLKCPKHLVFDFKSYHGFPEVNKSTTETENIYEVSMDDLPAAKEEGFAFHKARKKRIEFKLAYNTAKSRARLYTWDDAGKHFYSSLYKSEKEDDKSVEKYVKSFQDDPASALPERIRNVERQMKSNIQLDEESNDESLSNITYITKYKIASKYGLTRLFLQVFKALMIPAQIVITCSREYAEFDPTFDTWSYLDEYLLFFPETNGFLSPYNLSVSYPVVEPEFTSQKGLFIEPVEIGALKSGLATIGDIPALPFHLNADDLDITVNFNPDFTGNEINLKRQFNGYNAIYVTPYYHLMSDQQKLTMIDDLLKQTAPGLIVKKWNARTDFAGEVDQFIMDVDFTSSHFVERAGPRILFKIGLLIGPQTELYSDDERIHAVENNHNRSYERIIKVNIPAGYSIKNPDDMEFIVLYKDGDNVPFSFETFYTLEGQVLTLNINEYYKEIYAPLDRYEEYRSVINAAADFNKVTLVLEKQK